MTLLIGLQTLVMALVLILQIWGANLIPSIAVVLAGLAILQRDMRWSPCQHVLRSRRWRG